MRLLQLIPRVELSITVFLLKSAIGRVREINNNDNNNNNNNNNDNKNKNKNPSQINIAGFFFGSGWLTKHFLSSRMSASLEVFSHIRLGDYLSLETNRFTSWNSVVVVVAFFFISVCVRLFFQTCLTSPLIYDFCNSFVTNFLR